MEIVTTTTTTRGTRRTRRTSDAGGAGSAERRLLAFARGTRYECALYRDGASGAPLAATTGTAIVVLGADTLESAEALVARSSRWSSAGGVDAEVLPPPAAAATVIRSAARDWSRASSVSGVAVGPSTVPSADLVAIAREHLARESERAAVDAAAIERRLERLRADLTKGAKVRGVMRAEERRLRAARELAGRDIDAELAATKATEAHGLRVGDAAVDLRLVRAALRALGASTGELSTTGGAQDALRLTASGGIALVMPFRVSPR